MAYTPPPGYRVVGTSDRLPANWKLLESQKGRRVYETPPPRILIQTRKQLSDLQKLGKCLELDPSKVFFLSKQKVERKQTFHILDNRQCDSSTSKSVKIPASDPTQTKSFTANLQTYQPESEQSQYK